MRKMKQGEIEGINLNNVAEEQAARATKAAKRKPKIAPTLVAHIEQIVNAAIEQRLDDNFWKVAKESLEYVAERMNLTIDQALLFALFIEKCTDQRIQIDDFARMIGCRTARILAMMSETEALKHRQLIKQRRSSREESVYYSVPIEVLTAVKENRVYTPEPIANLSADAFFDKMAAIFDTDYDDNSDDRLAALDELVENNRHLGFCKLTEQYELSNEDRLLYYVFCNRLVNEDDDMIGVQDWREYFANRVIRFIKTQLRDQVHTLILAKIIEPCNTDGMANTEYYHLTQKSKDELFAEIKLVTQQAKNDKSILKHTDITAKQLFYNDAERAQIDRLVSLLDPAQFATVQQRLTEGGMRKGFACLFYGSPGTGKTETVYQIARRTGRDIMPVDVSQIKSCWVGDSEKNIKKVFDKYRELVKQSEQAPILLFNEADAVLGIRQEGAERAVEKMENSIQNIILQEMETLDGIMIATTNLTQNLDKAFERRFLYKIEFAKPSIEAKRAIWQSMMPTLSAEDAVALASAYDFSGGQIENIARKRTVETIINGVEPAIEQLHTFCRAEIVTKTTERKKIGY